MSEPLAAFAPLADAYRQFATAAAQYLAGSADGAGVAAARAFAQFLRDQSGRLVGSPWSGPLPSLARPDGVPALGLTREHQGRAQRAAAALGRLADAQRRLQLLGFDALRDAADRYVERLTARGAGSGGADPATLRGLYDAWIDCAEAAYARVVHDEPFCEALAEFVNAGSQWRLEQAAGVERASHMLDLPTRSEVNSLTQRLQAVEEELRRRTAPARPRATRRPKP